LDDLEQALHTLVHK